MTAREVARRVLERVDRSGAWATLALDGELARAGLAERDRRLAAELVYGVLRHRARLDRAPAGAGCARRELAGAGGYGLFRARAGMVPSGRTVEPPRRARRGRASTLTMRAHKIYWEIYVANLLRIMVVFWN